MQACIGDDQRSLVFSHGFVDVPNYELFKILVRAQTKERIQMLPIAGQQAADRIAILLGDCSLVAMAVTLEGAINAVPVSQLVSFFLCVFDIGVGTNFLRFRLGKTS